MSTTAATSLPDLGGQDVLLPYQKEGLEATAAYPVTFWEKSRRIGATWGIGADAVLPSGAQRAAGGMDTLYIGYNLDMAREFIDTCAMWAKAFGKAASAVEEFIFRDKTEDGDKDIQAFRINFASGFEIVALSSRPRSLRGRQGYVIVDEAAFHDDLAELLKAALALLIWGGKVLVISTHDGVDNLFNTMIQDVRAGKLKYKVLRTTFDDALEQGLYRRICLVKGETWSVDGERRWRQDIIDSYGDDADEELFCIPSKSGGTWLNRALIESRMIDAPVFRWSPPADDFTTWPKHLREAEMKDWLETYLGPELKTLDPDLNSGLGEDFGRTGDLTVFAPHQVRKDLTVRHPFLVELRQCPFEQQRQALFFILDRLPRFRKAALDARGNGHYLAEVAMQKYGELRIEQVMFSESWYRENTAPFKAAHEDGTIEYPRDAEVLDDVRAFQVVRGVPRLPDLRSSSKDGGKRHGDAGIALLLSHFASRQEVVEFDFTAAPSRHSREYLRKRDGGDDMDMSYDGGGAW
jgi:phage FluMu gp28-like protein